MKQKANKDIIRELKRAVHLLEGRLEKLESEKDEEERILGIGTYRTVIGKRKDGSLIFSRKSYPLEKEKQRRKRK